MRVNVGIYILIQYLNSDDFLFLVIFTFVNYVVIYVELYS